MLPLLFPLYCRLAFSGSRDVLGTPQRPFCPFLSTILLGLFESYFRDFCFILLYSLLKMVFIMQGIYVYCGKFRK